MINGVDMLIAVILLILIFLLIEGWDRYSYWSEWDRDRRRKRQRFLYEFQDYRDEIAYREHLRLIFKVKIITNAFNSLTISANRASDSFKEFNKMFLHLR